MRDGPALVLVLGQQRAGPVCERGAQAVDVPAGSRLGGGLLERVDVDGECVVGAQVQDVVAQGNPRRAERPARGVHRLVQVVRGCARVSVRPQHLEDGVAMHAVSWREREQLDERLGLAQAPAVADRLTVHRGSESAEQRDAHIRR